MSEILIFVGLLVVAGFILLILVMWLEENRVNRMSREERKAYRRASRALRKKLFGDTSKSTWGSINSALLCPHCQQKGKVRTMTVNRKKGISGGKATAAILTGGVSMLATELSRQETMTQAHCENCGSTWDF